MTIERRKLRWNGWGWAEGSFDLGDREKAIWDWIKEELGISVLQSRPAKPLDEIQMRDPALDEGVLKALRETVGDAQVKTDAFERAFHARGKSYADLLLLRAGDLEVVPDAVVYPRTADEVLAVVELAHAHEIAVVPYGGGSSVVGGVAAQPGEDQSAVITVDTTLLDRVLEVDEVSHTATIQAGIYGPPLEKDLGARGYTLGHFPQSFEFSTLGGWVAARGAGQQSNRYGRAEEWLVSARLATPSGFWQTESFPASAAGPNLNDFVAGCEGSLGIITEATVRIHPVPEKRDYRGYLLKSFDRGTAAIREIIQDGLPVAMLRLSDPAETEFLQTFSTIRKPQGRLAQAADQALRLGGYGKGRCMMLVGHEGDPDNVKASLSRTSAIVRKHGAFPLFEGAGRSWYKNRFAMPYLRDPMLDRGIGVDTLETSTRWSNVQHLHRSVIDAIRQSLAENALDDRAKAMVMCHVSHSYEDGCSLYFTFVFPQAEPGKEFDQWRAVKTAASDAIAAHGGTISHHHGVGVDHAPWMSKEKGEIGMSLLGALKNQIDPKGILNPGKLIS